MEFKYLFLSHLEVQLILRILLKWSFAFFRSYQLANHFRLWSVITLWSWDVTYKTTTSLFFRCWFFQQLRSILPSKFFSLNSFNSFRRFCVMSSSSIIPSSQARVLFFHVQPECCLNPFSLIRFLSRSNQSGFIVYLILWAFDSHLSRRSSLLLECSRFFAPSLEFLFHLIPFPFRLSPKISDEMSC